MWSRDLSERALFRQCTRRISSCLRDTAGRSRCSAWPRDVRSAWPRSGSLAWQGRHLRVVNAIFLPRRWSDVMSVQRARHDETRDDPPVLQRRRRPPARDGASQALAGGAEPSARAGRPNSTASQPECQRLAQSRRSRAAREALERAPREAVAAFLAAFKPTLCHEHEAASKRPGVRARRARGPRSLRLRVET